MKKMKLIYLLILALVIVGCSNVDGSAGGEDIAVKADFPEKTIELIVPYDAGGNSDGIARLLAESASKNLPNKQKIVIVNKPGGNGAIGTTSLMQSDPDGYTVGLVDEASLNIRPHLDENVNFTHDSFQTIMQVANVPQLIVTTKDSPIKTFEDLLDSDNKKMGITGMGGIQQLILEQLKNEVSDFQIEEISYGGSANVVTGVLSKEVPVGLIGVPNVLSNEDISPVINAGTEKSPIFPDLPTLKEEGYNIIGDLHHGILAPKGVEQTKVDILHAAFKKALEDPKVIEQLENMGYEISYANPEKYQQTISETFDHYGEVLEKAGL